VDFGLLPPEMNSGNMYAGPGSAPMLDAAAGWDDIAAELHAMAYSCESVITALGPAWQGPSSASMAAAVAPFITWLSATAGQAEHTSRQAREAVIAYETAFAATVPPSAILANRAALMSLIATNFLGQNAGAIAATEAEYSEMWAQDAAAMNAYADSSSAASQLAPFGPPPQTTRPGGTVGQSVAIARTAGAPAQTAPQMVQSLAAPLGAAATSPTADPPSSTPLLQLLSYGIGGFNPIRLYDPFGSFYDEGIQSFLAPFNNYNMQVAYGQALSKAGLAAEGAGAGTPPMGNAGAALSASSGQAGLVGSLSVPQGWASAAPATRPVAFVMPGSNLGAVPAALTADGQGSVFSNMALSSMAGRAVAGNGPLAASSSGGGRTAPGVAATATIIVIPED